MDDNSNNWNNTQNRYDQLPVYDDPHQSAKPMGELNDHANNKKNKSNFSYFWSADVIGM